MIALADAKARIEALVEPLDTVELAAGDAIGLALADDVVAAESVPPFANTAVDGYAVRAAETTDVPAELRIVGELAAGAAASVPVGVGEAIRIMTGAPMPDGADAVVMVEDTRVGGEHVRISRGAEPGDHVRAVGSDVAAGDLVFATGTVLGPMHLGVLASLDVSTVSVRRRARVGVLSTGDELVERGPLAPGQIRDANRPMLLALVDAAGATPVDFGIVSDDGNAVRTRFADACASCDVVVASGGVSVGDYDHVKVVLAELAPEHAYWWQVAIKPAKPLAFAVVDGTPVLGLPGNPVSSFVSFELFARPTILGRMGHARRNRPEVEAVAAMAMPRRPDGKLHLDRVVLSHDGDLLLATPVGAQASNVLSATAGAHGLALVPDGHGVAAGDVVHVLRLDAAADR